MLLFHPVYGQKGRWEATGDSLFLANDQAEIITRRAYHAQGKLLLTNRLDKIWIYDTLGKLERELPLRFVSKNRKDSVVEVESFKVESLQPLGNRLLTEADFGLNFHDANGKSNLNYLFGGGGQYPWKETYAQTGFNLYTPGTGLLIGENRYVVGTLPSNKYSPSDSLKLCVENTLKEWKEKYEQFDSFPALTVYSLNLAHDTLPPDKNHVYTLLPAAFWGKPCSYFQDAYQQGYYLSLSAAYVSLASDARKAHLYFSTSLVPEIEVYDSTGKRIRVIGAKGRHLHPPTFPSPGIPVVLFDSLARADTSLRKFYQTLSWHQLGCQLRSPRYDTPVIDTINGLLYRTYSGPRSERSWKEMLTYRSHYTDLYKELGTNPELYLQIYDLKRDFKLLWDEPVATPLFVLNYVDGYGRLWVTSSANTDGFLLRAYRWFQY